MKTPMLGSFGWWRPQCWGLLDGRDPNVGVCGVLETPMVGWGVVEAPMLGWGGRDPSVGVGVVETPMVGLETPMLGSVG